MPVPSSSRSLLLCVGAAASREEADEESGEDDPGIVCHWMRGEHCLAQEQG